MRLKIDLVAELQTSFCNVSKSNNSRLKAKLNGKADNRDLNLTLSKIPTIKDHKTNFH